MPVLLASVALASLIMLGIVFFSRVIARALGRIDTESLPSLRVRLRRAEPRPARPLPVPRQRRPSALSRLDRRPFLPADDRPPYGVSRLVPTGPALDAYVRRGLDEAVAHLAAAASRRRNGGGLTA